jgi:hypothetical protein
MIGVRALLGPVCDDDPRLDLLDQRRQLEYSTPTKLERAIFPLEPAVLAPNELGAAGRLRKSNREYFFEADVRTFLPQPLRFLTFSQTEADGDDPASALHVPRESAPCPNEEVDIVRADEEECWL